MKIINADLFTSTDNIILVTANSFITKKGNLVMGAGSALALRNKFRDINRYFGYYILVNYGHLGVYGCLITAKYSDDMYKYYGLLQTKKDFKDKSDLNLIKVSVNRLVRIITEYKDTYGEIPTVSLPMPGVGLGGLSVEEVYPIISVLPDTVSVYVDDKTMKDLKDKGIA
jgi:hypothetical protein